MYRLAAVLPSGRTRESDPCIARYEDATEPRLTLYALRHALERMNYACEIHVHTECAYLQTVTEQGWLITWAENDWKTCKGEEVRDSVLWCDIYRILQEDGHMLTVEAGRHEYSEWMRWQMSLLPAYPDTFRPIRREEL